MQEGKRGEAWPYKCLLRVQVQVSHLPPLTPERDRRLCIITGQERGWVERERSDSQSASLTPPWMGGMGVLCYCFPLMGESGLFLPGGGESPDSSLGTDDPPLVKSRRGIPSLPGRGEMSGTSSGLHWPCSAGITMTIWLDERPGFFLHPL